MKQKLVIVTVLISLLAFLILFGWLLHGIMMGVVTMDVMYRMQPQNDAAAAEAQASNAAQAQANHAPQQNPGRPMQSRA
jgi:hypothetical protein